MASDAKSRPGGLGWNRETATLALLSFAMFTVSLDQYIVVVALPDIAHDLGYSARTLQSVISAYAVASAGFLLFGGRAADLLGRRRVLATGLALYAGAAFVGGLATGPPMLLVARAVQGLGARWSSPPPWRSSTSRSPKVARATARWESGAERARPDW